MGPRGAGWPQPSHGIDYSGVVLGVGRDGPLAEVAMGDADRANGRPNTPVDPVRGSRRSGSCSRRWPLVRLVERGLG